MKKKTIIILSGIIIFLILIVVILLMNKNSSNSNINDTTSFGDTTNSHNTDERKNNDNYMQDENTENISEITIQGIVELNDREYVYIFNGEHFGEYGFEIDGYASANIYKNNQKCIDYITLKEYDTSYIKDRDMLICTGYFAKNGWQNFNTRDNPIIVLKSNDYTKMKNEALNNEREYTVIIKDYFASSNLIYLQYNISDKTYNLPFALNPKINDDTQIKGNLKKGKKVRVEYKELNVPLKELEIKSIEVIED